MSSERVQLGQYTLDIGRYELTRAGEPVRLERIPMDLLILLVRENGRLVTRDEIIERLWGKDIYFDTDNSINTAIRKIRRALGEETERPQYIETVLGKGYRFKGGTEVQAVPSTMSVAERPPIMLAVLPFENLSGDSEQEYFSDGLTEETIMRLGKMSPQGMGVIARTSTMRYKRSDKSVFHIGQELGVDYVLEGSVRRESDRIRVTAQLIRVSDQIHLWAENFDRPAQNILDIHSEVGDAIASQVKLKLTPEGKRQLERPQTGDQRAYDFYLHGRFHWARCTYPEVQKAIAYFRKATERDARFALAWSGLADSLMVLPINSDVAPKDAIPEAKSAITTALTLGQDFAEVHNSNASLKFWFEWKFDEAEAEAREAVRLDPNYSLAHLHLAHVLSNVGRHGEALEAIRKAQILDPFSLITNAMYGQFLYQAGRLKESLDQFHKTLEMESRFWVAHICMAKAYEKQNNYDEALTACGKAWEFSGGNSEALSLAGYIHAVSGEQAEARAKIQEMLERKKAGYVPPYNLALVFAGMREDESALQWLEEAFTDRDVHMTFLLDHKWDGLKANERFVHLLSRVGLTGL